MSAHIRVLAGRSPRKSIFALAAAVLLLAASQLRAAPEPAGKADILTGTVTVERAGIQDVLKPGDPLFLKDRIQTGAGSSAEIVFADSSRMKLASNTSLEITEYLYNPAEKTRQGLISLTSGKARFAVQDLQDFRDRRFRVQTRTAVVGSRDTDFIVAFDPQVPGGLLSALCLEYSIIVFSLDFPDKPALLTANMISQVYGLNLPTPPRFATAAELAGLLSELEQMLNTHIPPPGPPRTTTGGEQVGNANNPPPGPQGGVGTPGDFPNFQSQFQLPALGINQGITVTSTTTTTTTSTLPPRPSPCVAGVMGAGSPCPGAQAPLRGGPGVNQK
jgi:hypothetical protein